MEAVGGKKAFDQGAIESARAGLSRMSIGDAVFASAGESPPGHADTKGGSKCEETQWGNQKSQW